MTRVAPRRPGSWQTVRLLLGAARKRAEGRQRRQYQLLQNRAGKGAVNWGAWGYAASMAFMVFVHGAAAFAVITAITSAERLDVERFGRIAVSHDFALRVRDQEQRYARSPAAARQVDLALAPYYRAEADRIVSDRGGMATTIERRLRSAVGNQGSAGVVDEASAIRGVKSLPSEGRLPRMLGSIVLLWWGFMLVCQGEGLELDLQRRRHPMWEWLLSHPVRPAAVFVAEMLSPIAGNPLYLCAPLFPAILYSAAYNLGVGILAALFVGIPITVAAACLGKALEIGVVLRLSLRTRGAVLGLLGWLGYASMLLLIVGWFAMSQLIDTIGYRIEPLAVVPWPWLGLFLGARPNGSFSLPFGVFICWLGAGLVTAGAVGFSVWGARQGLSGRSRRSRPLPVMGPGGASKFGKEPLYIKELLWFRRDPGAIVQTILIPLTLAGFQLINMRGVLTEAQSAWNYLCGAAILFGTYFLWVLGPRSLASEGAALWIALSWPRGLESLLKAKTWLWSLIASAMVSLVLCYACFRFPGNIWQISLVGVGWFPFARSMAEKAVTLVAVPSSSGELEKIPWGRRWAPQLGMLTFAVGVLTQQWSIAFSGIVYSSVTAAAMWQNLRARLPFLYDPWSERLPVPPTLMHGMIAISVLNESGAVLTGIAQGLAGGAIVVVLRPIIYGLCGVIICAVVCAFLDARGVALRDIVNWEDTKGIGRSSTAGWTSGLLFSLRVRPETS